MKTEPTSHIQPNNWAEMLDGIRIFRKSHIAPVDIVGCERLADSEVPRVFRYQILVSLQLSSQTKDEVTAAAVSNLKTNNVLNVESIATIDPVLLDKLISKVGFHNKKVVYLQQTAQILIDRHNSDVPSNLFELLALPGIGPKMAHLILQCAWGQTSGIGVDTHVHRISNRLGWVHSRTAEGTRKELEEWLPKSHWREINALLVGFGQTQCSPLRPNCDGCVLSKLCPKIMDSPKRR